MPFVRNGFSDNQQCLDIATVAVTTITGLNEVVKSLAIFKIV